MIVGAHSPQCAVLAHLSIQISSLFLTLLRFSTWMANIYSICGISDATVRDYLEQISLWPAATSKMLRYRRNAIANKSARICWKSQTYDNALMSKIQQSFASVIVRPAWRTAFLEALIGGSKIHLNRKSRRICRCTSALMVERHWQCLWLVVSLDWALRIPFCH